MKKKIFIAIGLVVFFSLLLSAGQAVAMRKYFGKGHPVDMYFGKDDVCDKDGYVEYMPVFFDPVKRDYAHAFYTDEDLIRPGHYERIKVVLEQVKSQSGIDYKMIDNKVFVDCTLWKDKDSMMNLTIQAESKNFFKRLREDCLQAPNRWCSANLKSLLDKIKGY